MLPNNLKRLNSVLLVLALMAWAGPTSVIVAAEFQSIPAKTVIKRIAFGSCAFQWDEQKIWDTVVAAKPDIFLYIGDAIYGDYDGKQVIEVSKESLSADWNRVAAKSTFKRLQKNIPIMATWDNHDYGKNDGGAEFVLKDVSRNLFLDFFGEPKNSERRRSLGLYDARIFGLPGQRVQIILLDTRYFKEPYLLDKRSKKERAALGLTGTMGKYVPNKDPNVTLLGADQWQWLESQLNKQAEVRFIVSSTQVIPDEKGMDEWGNYPLERQKLFDLIADSGADGVILLSGNVHFAEISKVKTKTYPLFEFTSSGLTHNNHKYAKAENSYRVTGPYDQLNFGLIEIHWNERASPRVTFKAIGINGTAAFEHKISLGQAGFAHH